MITPEIQDYVTKKKAEGISDEVIKANLLSVGWPENQITEALAGEVKTSDIPLPKIPTPPAQTGTMWDSFQHILMFISMYVLYISLALMIHQYIDKWAPGVTNNPYASFAYDSYNTILLRIYMAALIVSFPLFSFFFIKITKHTKENPNIKNMVARKLLTYGTLVVTFIVVLVNVVQAVYGFLEGNVTFNFVLHFLNTVGLSSIIFIYYLGQVKGDRIKSA